MGDGTCPAHGNITQALDRIEQKLDRFTVRLEEGAIRFENHEGRIRACEANDTSDKGKANDWRKMGMDILKVLIIAGLSIALGMKL